ncbi:MAG: hypothetical protein KH135_01970 [Firmicutes bacterium]|nr:hypothetical protein [Bacillota bacterium]
MESVWNDSMTPLMINVISYFKGVTDAKENKIDEEKLKNLGDKDNEFYMYGMKDEQNSKMIATTSGSMNEKAYQHALEVLTSSTAVYQATNMVEPLIIQTKMSIGDILLDTTSTDHLKEILIANQLTDETIYSLAKTFIELYLSTYNTKLQLAKLKFTNVANGLKAAEDLKEFINGILEARKLENKPIELNKYKKKRNMFLQGMIAEKSSRFVGSVETGFDKEKYEQTLLLLTVDIAQSEANTDLCILDFDERKKIGLLNPEEVSKGYHKKSKTTDEFLKTIENTFLNGYTDMYNMKMKKVL